MNIRKLYICIGINSLLILLGFFFYFTFRFGFDPTRMFVIVSVISILLLGVVIFSTIRYKKTNNNTVYQVADWCSFLAISLILITSILNFFVMPARVIGDSMNNTLYDGDFVITYHFNYTPKVNDVCAIFIDKDANDKDVNYVKRIAAVPGDDISIKPAGFGVEFHIYINDKLYLEDKTINIDQWKTIVSNFQSSLLEEFKIPEGYYLAFGDNWGNSTDSRSKGLFPLEHIRGKVFFRIKPFGAIK